MPAVSIAVPSRLTADTVLVLPDDVAEEYELDASRLTFVHPGGLVQLSLALHSLARKGVPIRFIAPYSLDVDSYLARMDFYSYVPTGVSLVNTVDVASLSRTDRGDVLIPLKAFRTPADVEELAESLAQFLRGMGLPVPLYTVLWRVINELCDNAASHSGSTCGGVLAAQTYKGRDRYVAVGDIGIGIRKHLAYNSLYANLASDEAAIREAIKPGVTGTAELRGWGFEEIQTEASRLVRATLLIRSGTGWGRITIKGKRRGRHFGASDSTFHGTLVQLVLTPA